MRVAVLGAGAWGCALATLLANLGHAVGLWEIDAARAAELGRIRENRYLGIRLPPNVEVTPDLASAIRDRAVVVIATPSDFVRSTLAGAAPHFVADAIVTCAAKGLEATTHLTMDRVIGESLPGIPVALLSGPTFAKEVAAGLPAAVVAAARDERVAAIVQRTFSGSCLRVYTSEDVVGVALGGALKNVVAIAVGVSDGLGFGSNARAAIITRGLSEMGRLAVRMGAHPLTLAGLAGLGDLVLTCTGDLSRNRQVGLALARGEPWREATRRLGQVAEGVSTALDAAALAAEWGVAMPITTSVAAVLHEGKPPRDAVAELLSRDFRPERD